jgi:hypothetical protein
MRAYESAAGWSWPQPKVLEALARLSARDPTRM